MHNLCNQVYSLLLDQTGLRIFFLAEYMNINCMLKSGVNLEPSPAVSSFAYASNSSLHDLNLIWHMNCQVYGGFGEHHSLCFMVTSQ